MHALGKTRTPGEIVVALGANNEPFTDYADHPRHKDYCVFIAETCCDAISYSVFAHRLGNPHDVYPLLVDPEHMRSSLVWILGHYDETIIDRDLRYLYSILREFFFETYSTSPAFHDVKITGAAIMFWFTWSPINGRPYP